MGSECSCSNRDGKSQEFSKILSDDSVVVHDNIGMKITGTTLSTASKSLPTFKSTALRLTTYKGSKHYRLQALMENSDGDSYDQIIVDIKYYPKDLFKIKFSEYDSKKENIERESHDLKELYVFSKDAV